MTHDSSRLHFIGLSKLTIAGMFMLLAGAGAGAQDMDPIDRYALAGKAIAPKVAQSITWGVVDVVSGRVDSLGSLQATMERMETSGVMKYGLPNLSHRMMIAYEGSPLLIEEDGAVNGVRGTLWGFGLSTGGDYRRLGSGEGAEVDWNGKVSSGYLGVDVRPVREMLAGLTAGVSQTSTEFEVDGQEGFLDHHMVTGSPYLSWVLFPGMWWWATATYGVGEATIADAYEPRTDAPHAGDSSLLSGAVGFATTMVERPGISAGSRLGVAVKGEGSINEFKVHRTRGDMPNLAMNTWRGRVLLQGAYEEPLTEVSYLMPTLEAGFRYDGGQGASGAGLELGGRLRFEDSSVGLTLEAYGRALVPLDDKFLEWTAGGLVRISSDRDGYGPFLHVTPSFENVETMASVPKSKIVSRRGRLDAELGYDGLKVDGVPGLLAPYGAVTLTDSGTSTYRWGSWLALSNDLHLNLEAQHERGHVAATTEHSATVSANLRL